MPRLRGNFLTSNEIQNANAWKPQMRLAQTRATVDLKICKVFTQPISGCCVGSHLASVVLRSYGFALQNVKISSLGNSNERGPFATPPDIEDKPRILEAPAHNPSALSARQDQIVPIMQCLRTDEMLITAHNLAQRGDSRRHADASCMTDVALTLSRFSRALILDIVNFGCQSRKNSASGTVTRLFSVDVVLESATRS